MKIFSTLILFGFITVYATSQSLSPEIISSSGDYFENSNVSLSWTLGEVATETYTAGGYVLTQGFQQPYNIVINGIDLDVLVYLEGPYSSGSMLTNLYDEGQVPNNQPYSVSPWFYLGGESVPSIPTNVIDWVLIDLRDATSAANALPATSVEMQAAFLLNDGSVVGLDGFSNLQFTATISNDPFVVIWHRNHLGIISANPPAEVGGVFTYNFSSSIGQAYGGGLGYKLIDAGVYGMVGGDANADGSISNIDKTLWTNDAGTKGYKGTDHNMDAQVNNQDKNDTWTENGSYSSQVPD